MKTINALIILSILTFSTFGQQGSTYACTTNDRTTYFDFTASEMHADEVLLQWRGDFHADDFRSFIVSQSTDGENFQILSERALSAGKSGAEYSMVTQGDGAKKLFYRLSGETTEGRIIELKTICLPLGKVGLSVVPQTTQTYIYLTAKEVCEISILDMEGKELSKFTLDKAMQSVDISSFSKGRYQIKTNHDHDHSKVFVERI